MATVPTYGRQVRLRPINQQEIRVNANEESFGAGVGNAVARVGEGLYDLGDALTLRQNLQDDASAQEAFNAYRRAQTEALRNPETGWLNRTGGNALDTQGEAEEDLNRARDRYADGLSPAAARAYNKRVDDLQAQAQQSLLTHVSQETRNYVENQSNATMIGYIEEAAANWADEALFDENMQAALAEQARLGALQGWDAATATNARTTLQSAALRQRITLAARDNPLAAEALLDQNREFLTAEDEFALDTGLEEVVLEAKANDFTQQFLRPGNMPLGVRAGTRLEGGSIDRADDGVRVQFALGPGRPNRPHQTIVDTITRAAEGVFGAGVSVTVTSGQEHEGEQVGSNRHGTGAAADFSVTRPDGTTVKWDDPDAAVLARALAEAGAIGVGYGEGYMGGTHFHADKVIPGAGQWYTWESGANALGADVVGILMANARKALEASGREGSQVNQSLIARLGDEVGARLIDAAKADPAAPAGTVLDEEYLAANPELRGKTVGEVYDAAAAALGDSPRGRAGDTLFDAEAAYRAAQEIADPALRAQVIRQIETQALLQDRANAAQRTATSEAMWSEYTRTGRTDFPIEMRQAVGQAGWTAFKSAVQGDQQNTTVTDPDTWETLTRMASSDTRNFATTDLAAHYAKLSENDRRHFVSLQEAARQAVRDATSDRIEGKLGMDFGGAYAQGDEVYRAMVDATAPASMDKEKRQRRLEFQRQLRDMMNDFYDREERAPNGEEVRQFAAVLTMPIALSKPGNIFTGGFDGINQLRGKYAFFDAATRGDGVSYDIAVKYDDIPLADRSRIAAQLIAVNDGRVPTNDEITEIYEQQQLLSVGLPPNVDISAVPDWLKELERAATPDVSDEELVELYQQFLASR